MKSHLLLALTLFSVHAFAKSKYSCDMFPGQQGGYYLNIRVEGNKAKVFTISPSEQDAQERYLTTLHLISKKDSLIKVFSEKQNKDGMEFIIRRGAGAIGDKRLQGEEFSFYGCD